MTDVTPAVGPDEADPTEVDADVATPRWVKVFFAVAVALLIVFVVALVAGGGDHGPGRH